MTEAASLKVAVRVRPAHPNDAALSALSTLSPVDGHARILRIFDPNNHNNTHSFSFDKIFWDGSSTKAPYATQLDVYSYLGSVILSNLIEGYNACLLAYGQTASGKTFTMTGETVGSCCDSSTDEELRGIIPRLMEELFERTKSQQQGDSSVSFRVECSFFEIYCEKVRDLVVTQPAAQTPWAAGSQATGGSLRVRHNPLDGPTVDGLSSHSIGSIDDAMRLLQRGLRERATAETRLNEHSSRSHAIFQLRLTRLVFGSVGSTTVITSSRSSKLNLVDLAGSERVSQSGAVGERFEEARNINLSLHTLGRVIIALAERESSSSTNAPTIPPYREAVLTHLLSDSLGGNSRTFMIATVSPTPQCYSQTMNTLRFAGIAQTIVNVAMVNEDRDYSQQIACLREQVANLIRELDEAKGPSAAWKGKLEALTADLTQVRATNKFLTDKLNKVDIANAQEDRSNAKTLKQQVVVLQADLARCKMDKVNEHSALQSELARKRIDLQEAYNLIKKKDEELTAALSRVASLQRQARGTAVLEAASSAATHPSTVAAADSQRAAAEVKVSLLQGQLAEARREIVELRRRSERETELNRHLEAARSEVLASREGLLAKVCLLSKERDVLQRSLEDAAAKAHQSDLKQSRAEADTAEISRLKRLCDASSLREKEREAELHRQQIEHSEQLADAASRERVLAVDIKEMEQLLMEETESNERHYLALFLNESLCAQLAAMHTKAVQMMKSAEFCRGDTADLPWDFLEERVQIVSQESIEFGQLQRQCLLVLEIDRCKAWQLLHLSSEGMQQLRHERDAASKEMQEMQAKGEEAAASSKTAMLLLDTESSSKQALERVCEECAAQLHSIILQANEALQPNVIPPQVVPNCEESTVVELTELLSGVVGDLVERVSVSESLAGEKAAAHAKLSELTEEISSNYEVCLRKTQRQLEEQQQQNSRLISGQRGSEELQEVCASLKRQLRDGEYRWKSALEDSEAELATARMHCSALKEELAAAVKSAKKYSVDTDEHCRLLTAELESARGTIEVLQQECCSLRLQCNEQAKQIAQSGCTSPVARRSVGADPRSSRRSLSTLRINAPTPAAAVDPRSAKCSLTPIRGLSFDRLPSEDRMERARAAKRDMEEQTEMLTRMQKELLEQTRTRSLGVEKVRRQLDAFHAMLARDAPSSACA